MRVAPVGAGEGCATLGCEDELLGDRELPGLVFEYLVDPVEDGEVGDSFGDLGAFPLEEVVGVLGFG